MSWPIKKNTDVSGFQITRLETVNDNISFDKAKTKITSQSASKRIKRRFKEMNFEKTKKRIKNLVKEIK